ncbi:TRAP transporter large permease [Mollicutes bacterium LVI A0039]|nr:TRAP transporter large permease [Mollicutes bacterium LVI A0039]
MTIDPIIVGVVLTIIFFALLFYRTPIAIAIAVASCVTITVLLTFDFGVFIGAQKIATGVNSFTLLAVPFFILSGLMMNTGGIAQRLINFSEALLGKVPGSLALTNVAGNALFGSLSGSGIAAAAAMGGTLAPIEAEKGYDPEFSAAVNAISAPVGQLIPPTAAFIVFSLAAGGASISALFLAGWIPGIIWAVTVGIVALVISKKRRYPVSDEPFDFGRVLKTFIDALPSLALVFIIVGGIVGGIFTATEAAAIAVVYTFILSVFIYKTIDRKHLIVLLGDAAVMSAQIMFLVGASGVMGFVLSFTGIPQALSDAILGVSTNPIVILLLINIILLIVGTFMDMAPAILIFTPILLPIVTSVGIDPVHFGVIMVFNLAVGTVTPPVGTVLFVSSNVSGIPVEKIMKEMVPFFIAVFLILMLITYVPALSLWLPGLFGAL